MNILVPAPWMFIEKVADSDEDSEVTIIEATFSQRHFAELLATQNIKKIRVYI